MEVNIKRTAALLFILISLLVNIVLGVLHYQETSSQPTLTAASYLSPNAERYVQYLPLIKDYIESQGIGSKTAVIDFVRSWVNKNSVHEDDPSYNLRAAFNTPRVLSKLWKTHATKDAPVNLTCGPRTFAMQRILDELKIRSRVVMIFTDDFDNCVSHTFLEVFNFYRSFPDLISSIMDKNTC